MMCLSDMIKATEYRIDHPDFAESSCLHVRLSDAKPHLIVISNEFDSISILVDEWHNVAEAVYKLLEDHK